MRIALISVYAGDDVVEVLRDLGCQALVFGPLDAAEQVVASCDVVLIDGAHDLDLARFVLGRCRGADARIPIVVVLNASQLSRLDPSWPFNDFILRGSSPHEIYKRLRIVEWRASEFAHAERVKIGELVIDAAAHEVQLCGRRIAMAPMEFALLMHLARNRDRVIERGALLKEVWGLRVARTRTLDVHVQRLRAKLSPAIGIETVRGVGYRLMTNRGAELDPSEDRR